MVHLALMVASLALRHEKVKIAQGREVEFSDVAIEQFSQINQNLKEEKRQQMDPEDLKRRDRQASLLQEIKSRQLVSV